MNPNSLPSERCAVVGTIDPDAYTANTYVSDYVDMTEFERLMAIVMAGTQSTNGAIAAKLVEATSSTGAGAQDISGKAITGLAGTGDNDEQAIINLRADEMDVADGYTHVALSMTITGTVDAGAVLLGFDPHFGPASDNDLASVEEIIS